MHRFLASMSGLVCILGLVLVGTPINAAGEHAGTPLSGQDLTEKEIRFAIKEYIRYDQRLKNGFFYIYDKKLDRDWRLKFSKLHPVRVIERKGDPIYFACTNFTVKNEDSEHTTLDIDFWIHSRDRELEPYKIRIHKVDGVERFTYENDRPYTKN